MEKSAVFIFSSDKGTSSKELSDPLRYILNDICDIVFQILVRSNVNKIFVEAIGIGFMIKNTPVIESKMFW